MIYFGIAAATLVALLLFTRPRRGRRRGLFFALRHIKATPEQEKVIREAASDMKQVTRRFFSETHDSRPELAKIVCDDSFDEEGVRAWLAQRERTFDEVKPHLISSLHKIHHVLTPTQREKFGRVIETGSPRFFATHRRCRPSH